MRHFLRKASCLACALPLLFATAALADAPATDPAATPATVVLAAETVVQLHTVEAISSRTSKSGDRFRLALAAPLQSGDTLLLPAGTPVVGEVVHAAPSTFGGRPGELLLSARYIDTPHGQVRLRSTFGAAGVDQTHVAVGAAIVTFGVGAFIKGKEIIIPAGTAMTARLPANTGIVPAP